MKNVALYSTILAGLALAVSPAIAKEYEGGDKGHKKGKMLERVDTNKDGVISKSEFLREAEERFSKMDANGDGSISKEEGKAHHEAMRDKRKERKEKRSAE